MTDAVKMAIEALRWIVEREKSASSAAALEMARAATDALDKIAALEQAGEPVDRIARAIYEMNPCGEQPTDLDGRPTGPGAEIPWSDMVEYDPEYHAACIEAAKKIAPLPTLQRLGQEFDAGEAVVRMYERNPDVHLTFRAHPPQSRGQAFDGEGEGFAIGDPVEKFTGEAIWHGVVVASYLTSKGKRRYVVEVEPQGFQMIAVPSQLRALSSAKRGE